MLLEMGLLVQEVGDEVLLEALNRRCLQGARDAVPDDYILISEMIGDCWFGVGMVVVG